LAFSSPPIFVLGETGGSLEGSVCWKLCRPWSCSFIHTHGLEIATPEIPTLSAHNFTTKENYCQNVSAITAV